MTASVERCPCCDQPMPEDMRDKSVERRGLMVHEKSRTVYWRGVAMRDLPPVQTRFLWLLMIRRGRISSGAFDLLLKETAGDKARMVHMCRLRKWLAEHGMPFQIINHWGFGYELIETEDL